MFIFDMLGRDDQRLKTVALAMAGGLFLLLAGLWFVQVVSGKEMESTRVTQSFHTVAVPAVRGRLLDRRGRVLADSQAEYNLVLNLEELRPQFADEYLRHVLRDYTNAHPGTVAKKLPEKVREEFHLEADYRVVSNISFVVGERLQQPMTLEAKKFRQFYLQYRYAPLQILTNLSAKQVAIFSERLSGQAGLELEMLPARVYPNHATAAQLLGYVQRVGENIRYLAPDYEGETGIEGAFDAELRGQPGTNLVLVNNVGYRQREEVLSPDHPGEDIYLTIDLALQRAAEKALAEEMANARGAALVVDVRNGDVLAMASAPSFDPNMFVWGFTAEEGARLTNTLLRPEFNRATHGAYPPGSTFKIIDTIAGLESGTLDPEAVYASPGRWPGPPEIGDTAPAGDYNFERAFFRSSNCYFITNGLKVGLRKLLTVAHRYHLGELTHIASRQEVAGNVGKGLTAHDTANVSIGQEVFVTPLQLAMLTAAVANGGTNFWPRVVSRAHSRETGEDEELFAEGRVRDWAPMKAQYWDVLRRAMLADTEHAPDALNPKGGTGYGAFHKGGEPDLTNFRVAGKTGTAEVKSPGVKDKITWFVSYGPYESPRYAVVVMIESGGSGGTTCAPAAEKIYQAILKEERATAPKMAESGPT